MSTTITNTETDRSTAIETNETLDRADVAVREADVRIETAAELIETEPGAEKLTTAQDTFESASWMFDMAVWLFQDQQYTQANREAEKAIEYALSAASDATDALHAEIDSYEHTGAVALRDQIATAEETLEGAKSTVANTADTMGEDSSGVELLHQAEVELNYAEAYLDTTAAKIWDGENDAALSAAMRCVAHGKDAKRLSEQAETLGETDTYEQPGESNFTVTLQ